MCAIATLLLKLGMVVSGSDATASSGTAMLKKKGCHVNIGHRAENILKGFTVIYNSAIKDNNVELVRAQELGLRVLSRAEFLAFISSCFENAVGIAGCHGKTTATSMLANVLYSSNKGFLSHIGGEDVNLGSLYYSGKSVFLSEICEFKHNIDCFNSDIAAVVSSGYDHADCYRGADDLTMAFFSFLDRANTAVINGDDRVLSQYGRADKMTFGINNIVDISAQNISFSEKGTSFTAFYKEKRLFDLNIHAYGLHNVYNVLATICVALSLGIDKDSIVNGLERYRGVKRRFETVGSINGARVICDYAHHPDEIKACLSAIYIKHNNLHVVFQPHTYSRTKALFNGFVSCLTGIENLVIYKAYAAREEFDEEGSAERLFNEVKSASAYFCRPEKLKNHLLSEVKENDLVLVLGAGDIYDIIINFVSEACQ